MKRPLAVQGELGTHIDVGEVEEAEGGVIGDGSNSDVGKLKALLQHLDLEHFEAAIHRAGVLSLAQMASATDSVLTSPAVGLRKVHIRKLRDESRARVLADRSIHVQDVRKGLPGTPERSRSAEAPIDSQNVTSSMATTDAHCSGAGDAERLSPPLPPDVSKEAVLNSKSAQHMAVAKLPQVPLQKQTSGNTDSSSMSMSKGTLL